MAVNTPESTATPKQQSELNGGARVRNFLIALVAIALTIALSFGLRTETTSVSLDTQAEAATPLEVALSNGKPTLMEFYANWCTSCQAMAKDLGELKEQYSDQLNFVMLNVDNTKWLPELLRYRVDGIPHFVFLDKAGAAISQTIGAQPRSIMAANLDALVAGLTLPHAQASGQVSTIKSPIPPNGATSGDPRSHGSQVKL